MQHVEVTFTVNYRTKSIVDNAATIVFKNMDEETQSKLSGKMCFIKSGANILAKGKAPNISIEPACSYFELVEAEGSACEVRFGTFPVTALRCDVYTTGASTKEATKSSQDKVSNAQTGASNQTVPRKFKNRT